MQYSGDRIGAVVFAYAQAFAVGGAEEGVYPAEVARIEGVRVNGVHDEVEFVAAHDVGLGAGALVSRGPELLSVCFDLVQKLVGPELFELLDNVFGDVFVAEIVANGFDDGNRLFGTVDDEKDGDF